MSGDPSGLEEECQWFPELPECEGTSGGNNSGFPDQSAALALVGRYVVLEDPWIFPLMGNLAYLGVALFWTAIPMVR